MLGPSFVSGGQQVFEFVRMMAHNEVYLRCAQLANASRVQDHAEERSGYHCGDGLRRRALHGPQGPGYPEAHAATSSGFAGCLCRSCYILTTYN